MDDLGPLFQRPAPVDDGPRTWSVLELNQTIEAALESAFPQEIWVRGEIQGLSRTKMRRHWYFELVEKEGGRDAVAGRIPVALLQWNRSGVEREMRAAPGFELDDNLEVRIRCRVGYYAPWGKLQLIMTGVDPAFTLGQMAANRERILAALRAEGLLERNAQLPLAPLPLRVGLITSVGSAAYNDFVQELARGGFGLRVEAIDARVQGAELERTVIAALATFARRRPDLVVLIRGGGSRSDLAGFDGENVARLIARMPVPVWTGIGHEIDRSVADEVAHTAFKTPTACAAALNERVREAVERMEESWERVAALTEDALAEERARLGRVARTVGKDTRNLLRAREQRLAEQHRRLAREGPRSLRRAEAVLAQASHRALSAVRLRLARRQARLLGAREALSAVRLRRVVKRRLDVVERFRRRLLRVAPTRARHEGERLVAHDRRVMALDPRRVLRRGYSLSFDAEGRLLRTVAAVVPGSPLRTQLADGTVDSRVERTHPDPVEEKE